MTQLHFIERGDSRNDTITFLHGMGVASRFWVPQFESFAKAFHVLAPDLPGFAKSASFEGFSLEGAARAVHDFIGAKTSGNVHLCGVSLGAMVALQLASARPPYLKSLILSAPQIKPPVLLMTIQNLVMSLMPERFLVSQLEQTIPAHDVAMRGFTREDLRQTGKARLLEVVRSVGATNLHDLVRQITVPTYIINGTKDHANSGAAKKLARAIPNARLDFIADAGHLVSYEKAGEFNQKVLRFLDNSHAPRPNVSDTSYLI